MTPYYDRDGITIYHGHCEDVLPTLQAGSVDLVLTDPPYSDHVHGKSRRRGIEFLDATEWRACINRARDLGFESMSPELMAFVSSEAARISRRWTLIFSDMEQASDWRESLKLSGLEYIRTGVWVKLNATPQFTGDRPAAGCEAIAIAHQPVRKVWNGGGKHAVWTYPIVMNRGGNNPRLHATQKPEELMRELIALFSNEGELIVDPFMGSGTTLRAAKDLGRRAIGIETNERYCEIAVRRLQQSVLPIPTEPAAD